MDAARKLEWVSVEDYVAGEPSSEVRHEYVNGVVYAMAGASEDHNAIAGNLFVALRTHLRHRRCRVFMADLKLRVEVAGHALFYYPDVMVACDPRDTDRLSRRFPKVLIEVLSEETERTDRREKPLSYTKIETLEEYVLVAQDALEVTVFRRSAQWRPEILRRADQELRLTSLDFALPLGAVYEGVRLPPAGA